MSRAGAVATDRHEPILRWAVDRRTAVHLTSLNGEGWSVLKSNFVGFDEEQGLLLIAAPVPEGMSRAEFRNGDSVGVSFRRGHKKCLFITTLLGRRAGSPQEHEGEVWMMRRPDVIRELQRRAYQRATVPPDRFIGVRLWEGGLVSPGEPSWPICSGRVADASVGGIQVDVRADQNPRLSIGDVVGVEITPAPNRPPLLVEAQYRHCSISGPGRLALGFQFVGLEHDVAGRSSIEDLADFVRDLQRMGRNASS